MATRSTRESRRKKILERGSDRLAFITGQLQGMPPHQNHSNPPPPSVPHGQDPPPNFSSQAAVSSDVHDKSSSPVLLQHHPSFDADQSQTSTYNGEIGEETYNGEIGEELISGRHGTSIEPSKESASDTINEGNSLPVSLDDQISLVSTPGVVRHSETWTRQHNFFNPKQISSAIDASEKTRLLCSVVVAVLVVLLHLGFSPLGNRFLGSIISFRPLYFILLTNVTLVIARLLSGCRGSSQRDTGEENKAASTDEYNWAEQLSKTLEVGLVAKKVIDAVLMDCSVYAIIVICSLSLT